MTKYVNMMSSVSPFATPPKYVLLLYNTTCSSTTRNARTITHPRTRVVIAVRTLSSNPSKNPAPPPLGPPPLAEAETKGSGRPFLVGGLVAGIGVGAWWYYNNQKTQTQARSVEEGKLKEGDARDVRLKARELDHAARVQTQQKIEEGRERFDQAKADGRAKIDSAQSSIQSSYNDTTNKASSAAADAQARLASYKDAASTSLQQTKEATEKAANDARAQAEDKAHQVQSSWWSWFGWGKSKSEDLKEGAAGEAAKAAKDVKEKAAEAEQGAQKRT